jgi:hypothetical protein
MEIKKIPSALPKSIGNELKERAKATRASRAASFLKTLRKALGKNLSRERLK